MKATIRILLWSLAVAAFLLLVAVPTVSAAETKKGDILGEVNFSEPSIIADQTLPAGDYRVRHLMDGGDHIMVFQLLKTYGAVKQEFRVKCQQKPLAETAKREEQRFMRPTPTEHRLVALVFKGAKVEHTF